MSARRIGTAAIGAGLAIGAAGVLWRLIAGHEPAGYGSYIPWGLWVAMYVYFSGLSAGAFVVAALVYVFRLRWLAPIGRLALVAALAGLVSALLLIGLDLGHLERFWRVFVNGNPSSVMAWMIWLYTAFGVVLAAMLVTAFRPELAAAASGTGRRAALARWLTFGRTEASEIARAEDARRLRLVGIAGLVLAVAFSGALGALMGVLSARPYVHSPLMPILFIAGVCIVGYQGVSYALIGEIAGKARTGTGLGLMITINSAAATVGTPIFGHIVDRTGSYAVGWQILAVTVCVGIFGLALLLQEPKRAPTR